MKPLYIKEAFGGLGQAALITGGHTGVAGIQAVVMAVMDTGEVAEVILIIGVVLDLGVGVDAADLVVLHEVAEDLVEVEAVAVEVVDVEVEVAVVDVEAVKKSI